MEIDIENQPLMTGEALDRAIAEHVMGYKRIFDSILGEMWLPEEEAELIETPTFSTSLEDAGKVIDRVKALHLEESLIRTLTEVMSLPPVNGKTTADLDQVLAQHNPSPQQICQAALEIVKNNNL